MIPKDQNINDLMAVIKTTIVLVIQQLYSNDLFDNCPLDEDDILMVDSSGVLIENDEVVDYKHSFHLLVLPELLCVKSSNETRIIYNEVIKRLDSWYVDNRVVDCIYKSMFMLRTVGSVKDRRMARILPYKEETDPFVLFLYSCVSHTTGDMIMLQSKQGQSSKVEKVSDLIDQIPNNVSRIEKHVLSCLTKELQYFTYRSRTGNVMSFNRIRPSYCEICKRYHDKDHTLYVTLVTKGGMVIPYQKCRHSYALE
jgi:hypothetical protein